MLSVESILGWSLLGSAERVGCATMSSSITNFAEKAPAFRRGDESARQTWHFGKTLLQNDEVSGIIVASLDSPKESGCAGDEKETA